MTLEEAGEIVLSGKAWRTCPGCQGTGKGAANVASVMGLNQEGKPVVERLSVPDPCLTCKATGVVPSKSYVKACKLIGKKGRPPRPGVVYIHNSELVRSQTKVRTVKSIEMSQPSSGTYSRITWFDP